MLVRVHVCTCVPAYRAAAKAEGELIRRKAVEEAEELSAKEAAWRAQARAMNAATKASNDTLLAFRAAERQREQQLEAAVEGESPTVRWLLASRPHEQHALRWQCILPCVADLTRLYHLPAPALLPLPCS